MSKIQGKPFIELVVDTLGDLKTDFLDLVNGSDKTPEFRSLINASAKITGSDKGKVQYVVLETWSKTYTGYLIYNNTYCVLVAFSSNTQALTMLKIDVAKQTFITVKEYLDINELRRYLEEASEHITSGEIDSGEAQQGNVLFADGNGGAEWGNLTDAIKEGSVDDGDVTQIFGFDSEGNLKKDTMPEGIVVDETIIEDSPNAVAGGAVYGLKEDVEALQGEMEDKANVDGNYPTMTVGVANDLSPYDESSGDEQDTPFSFQATGTGNGTQPDFSTGEFALMKEKQGNTVVVNQLARPLNANSWGFQDATGSFSDGVATFTSNATDGQLYHQAQIKTLTNHKYIFVASIKTNASANEILLKYGWRTIAQNILTSDWQLLIGLLSQTEDVSTYITISDERTSNFDAIQVKNVGLIDITQWFNGDIPQDLLDHPEHFFRYYQGSLAYNEGTLVNANGRYIKCIGRQQWDEEFDSGHGLDDDGTRQTTTGFMSNNYIPVIPNETYYLYLGGADVYLKVAFFDAQNNFIKIVKLTYHNGSLIDVPSNAVKMLFDVPGEHSGTTYNHDITISIYYEGESGYDQYYPYEVLTNNDTGTEVLRKAGNVCDSKTPDGTITRRIGVVDLGTLTFGKDAVNRFYANLSNCKPNEYASAVPNVLCSKYSSITPNQSYLQNLGITIVNNSVYIYDSALASSDAATFKTAMSGVYLFYELAEPTTEQGTPYSENLVIDDFGSMDFAGTNGVPQGALIFYPVDYKAFIDTLYKYTDGTPSNIALKSDLSADKTELQGVDSQLQNAIGGTLRQCLCVKESLDFDNTAFVDLGDVSWTYYNGVFSGNITGKASSTNKMLCSKYKTNNAGYSGSYPSDNNCIWSSADTATQVFIKDVTYTDAIAFKNAMKGVLLAYEKASE